MKKLNLFQSFDFVSWQKGKEFKIQSAKFNEKKGCVSLDVIITADKTDYGDPSISNVYERFKVHCVNDVSEDDIKKYHVMDTITFVRVGRCTVWGDYGNQLSVEAELEVVKK